MTWTASLIKSNPAPCRASDNSVTLPLFREPCWKGHHMWGLKVKFQLCASVAFGVPYTTLLPWNRLDELYTKLLAISDYMHMCIQIYGVYPVSYIPQNLEFTGLVWGFSAELHNLFATYSLISPPNPLTHAIHTRYSSRPLLSKYDCPAFPTNKCLRRYRSSKLVQFIWARVTGPVNDSVSCNGPVIQSTVASKHVPFRLCYHHEQ